MKKKVYVGMSGGVDSSVVAMMMRDAGYDVTGVFIRTWQPDYIECTWREDRLDAMRVATALDIKFETIDLSYEYKKGVIDYMISEYKSGCTPNPDIMCNKEVKFGAFYKYIKSIDPDAYIATGHYARIDTIGGNACSLCKAIDQNKDQVYFLSQIDKSILSHIMFPLGEMKKSEVRNMARINNICVSDKKDSQGLCMLGDISIKDFLRKEIDLEIRVGKILNIHNEEIGDHEGAIFYTIGERISVDSKETNRYIYYVINKDIDKNIVYVATSQEREKMNVDAMITNFNSNTFTIKNWNQTSSIEIKKDEEYKGQTRYHGPIYKFKILEIGTFVKLETLDNYALIAPGQTLVLYDGDIMLGGGIIVQN